MYLESELGIVLNMEEVPQEISEDSEHDVWRRYYELTKNGAVRPLLKEAVLLVTNKDNALDLGSGALTETAHMIASGFKHVTAVDKVSAPSEILKNISEDQVSFIQNDFDKFDFPVNFYNLINAQFSLPFNHPATFTEMFSRLKLSLKSGGIFSGQFFGKNDDWNKDSDDRTFHTKEEVQHLLDRMEIIKLEEKEFDGSTALNGEKHWHVFDVIAKKI